MVGRMFYILPVVVCYQSKTYLPFLRAPSKAIRPHTFNAAIAAVQEHAMILNGLKRGVSEEKLAKALNVDVASIKRKRDLLNGICKDAIALLKDKDVTAGVFPILRKMQDVRQLEAASLMVDANLYTTAFAKSILLTTPNELLVEPEKKKKTKGYSEELLASMEHEREMLDREYRLVIETLDTDIYHLTLMQNWLTKIMKNGHIKKYLEQSHPDVCNQFAQIVGMKSLVPKEAI